MKSKLFIAFISVMLVVGLLPCISFADTTATVKFYNTATNLRISEIGDVQSVYAKISFVAPETGTAQIFAANYSGTGSLLSATPINTVNMTEGETVNPTIDSFDVSGADAVKVFAWYDFDSVKPVMQKPAVIKKSDPDSYAEKFELVFENTDKYLYRVGNANAVSLGSLFTAVKEIEASTLSVTVEKVDANTNVSGTFTANTTDWTKGTLKFTGTGPVKVTITDNQLCTPTVLYLEVVDAANVTDYSELGNKNSVLLDDITMSSGGSYYLSNATLYGNGFTFDVTNGGYTGTNVSSNYLVSLANSSLDNVKIIGAVYTEYGAQVKDDYNRATVLSTGNNTIANCYISNCASPVRVNGGNIEIINTTLKGGNFANLDIRNGNVTLDNVTTINQVNGNDTAKDGTVVVGLGVVVYYENVLNTTKIDIKNGITQYNHLSESQSEEYITDSTAQQLVGAMFGTNYTALQYNDGTDKWINTGIISMTSEVGDDNISDVDGYISTTPTFSGKTGYVHTKVPDAKSIAETAPNYVTVGQNAIAPTYSFDYTTKNYVAKTDGSNDYCYEDNGTVLVSFDEGDTFSWDTSILTATKAGQTLNYTVAMNGTDYTGKSIAFNTTGDYTVTYTYTDSNNYRIDESGNITKYDKIYTKNVYISVSAVKAAAKNAEFTFGSSSTASKKVTIGNDTYVMPDVSATSSTIGSTTVSGQTIYYPIVNMFTSDGEWSHSSLESWYACFPVFDGAVTITDYADVGTGDAVIYNSSTQSLPSGLSIPDDPATVFKYSASASAPTDPAVVNGVLCYKSPTLSNNARSEQTIVVKYMYKDNAGATYYYYVGYYCKKVTEESGCVTPDTLVTLADGSQKRIDEITYADKLLVWNLYEGKYDAVPSAIIFDHGYDNNTVIKLMFDDGTEVKIVNLHQFMDAGINKFVDINANNVQSYLGHDFVKRNNDGYKTVKLVDYDISEEYIEAYGIISAVHYNILIEDMFSTDFMPEDYDLFNYFEIGEDLKYDEAKMNADIQKYGLYSYEDFSDYLTPEQFEAFNVKYMKVAVGKGNYTYDGILALIKEYLEK